MKIFTKFFPLAAAALCFAGSAFAADFTMKISASDPKPGPEDVHYARTPLLAYAEEIEKKSNGRIDVQIFWGDQLGKAESVVNLVRNGQVEAILTGDGQIAPFAPDIEILGIPYLFINRKVAHEVFDGDFGKMLSDRIAKNSGLRPMPFLENGGYRHYSSNTMMSSVEDIKGLKIRTMNNPVHMQIVRSLGASPTPIPWADLYTSLQTGVVDGQENALSTFRVPKLEEVQKFIVLDGHVYSVLVLAVSQKWLDTLPEDMVSVISTAADNMKKYNRQISIEREAVDRKYLESKGVTITDLPSSEKAKFQDLTQADSIKLLEGKADKQLLDTMFSTIKTAEQAHK